MILCEMDGREEKITRMSDVVVTGNTLEGVRAMADLLLLHKQLLASKTLELAQAKAQLAIAEARVQAMVRPLPAAL